MTEGFVTVRDFFRHAVTSFARAKLSFGHGAGDAIDEAAYLILEALSLPIDDINPWLDARLSAEERERLSALIDERVRTRKPAAYLVRKAYIQGVPFYVDERVIVPRSFIGEILGDVSAFLPASDEVAAVLDLCTGSGCLAILAARSYPNADIFAADLSADALAVARRNVEDHGLVGRINLVEGDLFAPLGSRKFDLILANPPYVDAAAVAAFPPEYRAEPAIAHAGGDDGLDIVRRIIRDAPAHLNEGGGLLCEIGRGRAALERDYPRLEFFWPETEHGAGEVFWLTRDNFPG
jgi:ribosomal protein L3 glutamine methyltransferase